jgi:hypothetical protein
MDTTNTTMFHVDVVTVARLLGILVPILVALLTKRFASPALKAILNLVLSAVAGVVAPLLTGDTLPSSFSALFTGILNAFVISIIAYYGVLKPTGVTGAIAGATENFGVGSDPRTPEEIATSKNDLRDEPEIPAL